MNNKQNNVNRGLLDTSRTGTGNQYQDYISSQKKQLGTDQTNADTLRNQIHSSYTGNNNFMPGGLTPNSSGWFDLSGGGTGATGTNSSGFGSAAGGDFSSAKKGYQGFADTGGINRGDFSPALDSYKNFMNNGGLGESEADALRARATSQIPSFYNNYKQALSRRSNVQGGYSPGFDSQMAEIGRQAGREGFNASRQVEGDIVDKRLAGRQFGTSGYGSLMSDITGKEQTGKLAGLGGLTNIGGMEQQNNQFNAGLGETRANRNQAMQQFLMDQYQSGGKANAAGLQGLRSSSDATLNNTNSNFLGGLSGMSGNDLQNLAMRLGIHDTSFLTDVLPRLIGAGGTIASGFGNPAGASSGGGLLRGFGNTRPQYAGT